MAPFPLLLLPAKCVSPVSGHTPQPTYAEASRIQRVQPTYSLNPTIGCAWLTTKSVGWPIHRLVDHLAVDPVGVSVIRLLCRLKHVIVSKCVFFIFSNPSFLEEIFDWFLAFGAIGSLDFFYSSFILTFFLIYIFFIYYFSTFFGRKDIMGKCGIIVDLFYYIYIQHINFVLRERGRITDKNLNENIFCRALAYTNKQDEFWLQILHYIGAQFIMIAIRTPRKL